MAEKPEPEQKETKEIKERFELVEVPTQTGFFIKDNEADEVWDDKRALVEILNKLEKVERSVA